MTEFPTLKTTNTLSPYEELKLQYDELKDKFSSLEEEFRNLQCAYSVVKFGGVSK